MAQYLFSEQYNTPRNTVPFDEIRLEYFEPAILEGIRLHKQEIDEITDNAATPSFTNTIEAYERSGRLLDHVATVFDNLLSAETSDEMQTLAQKLIPQIDQHTNDINLNEKLFARIKAVYEQYANGQGNLTQEQRQLLQETYSSFTRNGANLSQEAKEEYRRLSEEESMAELKFGEHNLKETNGYRLHITDKSDLSGLPASTVEAAEETAREQGLDGWVFTLHAPSYVPFMKYADKRELRRRLYMAYNTRCTHGDDNDNRAIVTQLVNIRLRLAQLLGYENYASYRLERRMARNTQSVYKLLDQLANAYKPAALQEVADVQALARQEEGSEFKLMPWDWSYFAHKLKQRRFSIDDEQLRPYLELEQVKKGVFGLATRLYGITFRKSTDIQVYHKDVEAYEVFDRDGHYLAVLYTDFYPRPGKRSGAWMTNYKGQWKDLQSNTDSRPHVSIVMNFTKPTQNSPALLNFNELTTFLHEFGHSLHGIFANTTYESLSGTNVYWDFVELPSQFMENFATEKDFLRTFAYHYQTGEPIPDNLIDYIRASSNFNTGYDCLRQIGFGLLDMAWHTRSSSFHGDVLAYEEEARKPVQLLPSVEGTCTSTQFSHLFSGGYAAGYYSYKWAEVLDADAFALFKEEGIFNAEVAASFRKNILSMGGTEHPMTLYRRFRGQAPTIDALLTRNGIKQ